MRYDRGSRSPEFAASRRAAVRTAALVGSLAMTGWAVRAGAATAPKEAGLSYEGLLKGEPGYQPRSPASLPVSDIPGFLSKGQLRRNYAVYREAFTKLLRAESALQSASRDGAHANEYAALRSQQVGAGNAVLLHEFYFRNLAPRRVELTSYIGSNLSEHMGSVESWREDFTACARVAGAWAMLVYDPYDDRWHNVALGASDAGGFVGSNPLVVCDVAEHAWSLDYDDRETYVARFLDHIDWNTVTSRYRAVDRR